MIEYIENYLCDGHNIDIYIAPYLKIGEDESNMMNTKFYKVLKYKLGRYFTNNYRNMLSLNINREYGYLDCVGHSKRGTGILSKLITGQIFIQEDGDFCIHRDNELINVLRYAAGRGNTTCISYRFNGLVSKDTWESVCIPAIYDVFAHNGICRSRTCLIMKETPEEIILPPTITSPIVQGRTMFHVGTESREEVIYPF